MRPSATIIVTPRGSRSQLQACLDALRPTLGLRDHVIVRAVGTDVGLTAGLTPRSWLSVATSRAAGAAAEASPPADSDREVVVLLDGDTQVTRHWLDALVAPLQDASVVGSGPRTNLSAGPQALDVSYTSGRGTDVSRLARERWQSHRGALTDTPVLDGFALALRRTDLEAVGGLDGLWRAGTHWGADLSLTLTATGGRLVVCESAYVHRSLAEDLGGDEQWLARRRTDRELLLSRHGARADVVPRDVLLSACLIVKDEEARLPECLASLHGLVDEIVVYDTGSTDGTVDIARAAGALVVEGYWDHDFSRARNAALSHCSGQWILHVDADEAVEGDAGALRADLGTRVGEDVLPIHIDNLDDDGNVGRSHEAARLFRRLRGHWEGHLHEQVVSRSGEPLRLPVARSGLVLRHVGYTSEIVDAQDKLERNVRVAQEGVNAPGALDPRAVVNLGRALAGAGRNAEALERFAQVRAMTRTPSHLRYALRHGAELLIAERRADEALDWIEALRAHTSSTAVPDYLAGLAHLSLGDTATALRLFEGLDEVTDEQSTIPRHVIVSRRGLTYVAAGRFSEAADELLVSAQETRAWAALWGPLVGSLWNSDRPMGEAVAIVGEDDLLKVLGHSLHLTPEISDALGEQLWQRWPRDPRLLAFAGRIGRRLPLPRALEWSARLRSAGLDDCPLVGLAEDGDRDPVERLRAAAIGVEAFADGRCGTALRTAAADLTPARFVEALSAVDELSPRLLGALVVAAASTPERAVEMAGVLRTLGAEEQADALLLASA